MSDWYESPLETLVTIQKGRLVETSPERLPGYEHYLGASGILGLPDGYASTSGAVTASEGDVLMLWDGERSGLVGHRRAGVVASTVARLRPSGHVIGSFLYYALAHQFEWIQNRRTGSGVPHVPKEIGRILRVRFPRAIEAQRRIVAILNSLDVAIDATEALIVKQQHIKAGLVRDLLTRGLGDGGVLRPSSIEAPDLFRQTKIGPVPADWEHSGLQAKQRGGEKWIRTGPFGSALKGEHWVVEGRPVITIGSLGEGSFDEHELLFVGERDAARLAEFQLKRGDVVFSRVADVGRSAVVREENVGWIMSSNLMRIAVDATQVRPDFLQMLLAGDARVKAQIRAKVNSGGREVANSEILGQLLFAWPPVDEQDRIVARVQAAEAPIRADQERLRKLRMQKQGLMHDLLTGDKSVHSIYVKDEDAQKQLLHMLNGLDQVPHADVAPAMFSK